MSLEVILLSAAILIIAVLSAYAFYLIRKVKALKAEQVKAAEKAAEHAEKKLLEQRNELVKDLRFLANSVLQEQCEITEGVLRIQYVIERLDPDLWSSDKVLHIKKHYDLTSDMPILDDYKQLSKKEQMELDKKRWRWEAEAKSLIESDLRNLLDHQFS